MTDGYFGEWETDFGKTEAAERQAYGTNRIPEGTYKAVCTMVDIKGDGELVDHESFTSTNKGTKGLKIFLEILEPESVTPKGSKEAINTKGFILEHVFWVTKKMLPFIKRDAQTILGRMPESMAEMEAGPWSGKTCEIGIKDDDFGGFPKSKADWINEWSPPAGAAPQAEGSTTEEKKPEDVAF